MARVADCSSSRSDQAVWRVAQAGGLILTAVLLAGLFLRSETTLRLLWYAVIPLLPIVFLIQPKLWRNVCPLATLGALSSRRGRGRKLDARLIRWTIPTGILLLAVLVPARRFLFNSHGPALAVVIMGVAALAVGGGFLFERKAGFCNGICPVLPVERLYGQRPVFDLRTGHCAACSLCTVPGCLDLSRGKSIPQILGRARNSNDWLFAPYGVFAAAFPGFVLGYYLVPDLTLAAAGRVYAVIAATAMASYVIVASLVALTRVPYGYAMPALGALALLFYYWWGAAGIALAWEWNTAAVHAIRGATVLLLGIWLFNVVRRSRAAPAAARSVRPAGREPSRHNRVST